MEALRLGKRQVHGPLAVFPLRLQADATAVRTTSRCGGDRGGRLLVTEVSAGGSVPELRVVNQGDQGVLMLDGEELRAPSRTACSTATCWCASTAAWWCR